MNVVPEGSSVHEAEILDAPRKPEDPMEIERHEVTHIPPMPWCLACRLGNGRDASHLRSLAVPEAAQIQVDFCFLREDVAAYDATESVPENPWATILCAVDVSTQNPLAIALPGKNAELEYAIGQLIGFVKRLGYTELVIRNDGEPAITAIVDRLMADIKKTEVHARVRAERTPRYSSQSLGAVGKRVHSRSTSQKAGLANARPTPLHAPRTLHPRLATRRAPRVDGSRARSSAARHRGTNSAMHRRSSFAGRDRGGCRTMDCGAVSMPAHPHAKTQTVHRRT